MKKLIVASLCTLGLTLLGTSGNYQNSMNLSNGSNIAYASTRSEQIEKKTVQKDKKEIKKTNKKHSKKHSKKAKSKKINSAVKAVITQDVTYKNIDFTKFKSTNSAPATKPAPTTAPVPTTKPVPTQTPTSPAQSTSDLSSYANQVLKLVNQERAKEGLSALTTNSTISAAANKRAKETVQSFSHTRPDGTSFSSVLNEYSISYRASGENIAYGQKTPQEVVTAWMNSPGHRANIMNANFGKLGVGVYKSNGVIYWSQLFTN